MRQPVGGEGRGVGHHWHFLRTKGRPTHARICQNLATIPANRPNPENEDDDDLCASLTQIGDFALAHYAEDENQALLAQVLETRAGAIDLGSFGSTYKQERRRTRFAEVQGEILIANGRSDRDLKGGRSGLLDVYRDWEKSKDGDMPRAIQRLKDLQAAGAIAIELPTSTAVDLRFAGLKLAQPVVICMGPFRKAEEAGLISVRWSR